MLPLDTCYAQESETRFTQNPGKFVTIRLVGYLFGKEFWMAGTSRKAENVQVDYK